jgi:hypothetical protein
VWHQLYAGAVADDVSDKAESSSISNNNNNNNNNNGFKAPDSSK